MFFYPLDYVRKHFDAFLVLRAGFVVLWWKNMFFMQWWRT